MINRKNIVYFTILASYLTEKNGKIISYEANLNTFFFLKENITLNLSQNVIAINKAVYSSRDKLPFYISDHFSGNSSLFKPGDEYNKYFITDRINEEIEIEAEPLDIYSHELDYINIVKIDVEGAEDQTLLGMKNLFKKNSLEQAVFELNKLRMKDEWFNFFDYLDKYCLIYDVDFFTISDEGTFVTTGLDKLFKNDDIENVVMKFI
ncbi:FkbM family methyltransferase [Priestia aryabhattai]|uniref:FkbM family methyltransferase n=1 Tax=Priestia aryabhattai TaxID=412384 RepID=UPI002E241011|nr:FkbM family methyltransferase [Priestia aryabhattai]MED3920198.1 FkbM family methyltransferase [Priestia aryabhattai]